MKDRTRDNTRNSAGRGRVTVPMWAAVGYCRNPLAAQPSGPIHAQCSSSRGISSCYITGRGDGCQLSRSYALGCFFRQFYRSVARADYLTLRNGFIAVHLAPGSKFNFQKYIKRSLEDDFKIVVGVSPVLWASFVIYLLINVQGWQVLFWASFIPVIIILAVGTKLQAVLTKMAIEITERHAVVQGIPLVKASDKYFWFGRPHLVLHLIHCALFQNAFQITYFLWIWYSFGLNSCFHDDMKITIFKLAIGVVTLVLCSYSTLPLYALVTQMGSTMKRSVFDEQTSKALKKWHMAVKKRHGRDGRSRSPTPVPGASPMASPARSSGAALHRYQTTGHSTRSSMTLDDQDLSDMESDMPSASVTDKLIVNVADDKEHQTEMAETHHADERTSVDDFSFANPAVSRRSASFR
uniref:MLO-like protein n=1 Tax=Kalanchoe fedtschenkoi TaxID=63787 RepID=A0A7N0UIN2_KALFE